MADLVKTEALDHREVGHELARRSGVNLTRARKGVVRLWEARGLALIALVNGDETEVERIMAPYRRKGEPSGSG
ncbi:hypothetical protein DBR33_07600 [Stenotrophomonas sp. HMWF022]|nr:hypothetical protein DBR20_18005 [Stenotrophomonas sp. HMWF023]PTT49266.1 hypothetical protein DBR33_07600 [Stenotrophomonas sp. HMWF022]